MTTPPRKAGLGRGLSSLIPLPSDQAAPAQLVQVDQVRPSQEQMRKAFPADGMADLVESVREHGVLQPIVVRKVANGFELIAGERRLRAAKAAGLERIPAVVRVIAAPSAEIFRASQPSAAPGATMSVSRRASAWSWLSV